MAHIDVEEANAWLESTKLSLSDLDEELELQISDLVLSRLRTTFNTVDDWTDETSTPRLIRTLIAMWYAAAVYDRAYTDDVDDSTNNYAALLRRMAEQNILGLLAGSVVLEEEPETNASVGVPSFFPNDASSANPPSADFPSDGGPAFMMGSVF